MYGDILFINRISFVFDVHKIINIIMITVNNSIYIYIVTYIHV